MPDIDAEALRGLIERLEKATGGSRSLDIAIARALLDPTKEAAYWFWHGSRPKDSPEKDPLTYWDKRHTPELTTSLDAITALIGRLLPGWWIETLSDQVAADFENTKIIGAYAAITNYDLAGSYRGETSKEGIAATRPLALCLALLRAMEAEHG